MFLIVTVHLGTWFSSHKRPGGITSRRYLPICPLGTAKPERRSSAGRSSVERVPGRKQRTSIACPEKRSESGVWFLASLSAAALL